MQVAYKFFVELHVIYSR